MGNETTMKLIAVHIGVDIVDDVVVPVISYIIAGAM
jgi:hypothetical protein